MHSGQISIIHDVDSDGTYWVAALTGEGGCVCRSAEDLIRIGSIHKKVKRLFKQMGGKE
jgi:sugar lactone lactonase YvrE